MTVVKDVEHTGASDLPFEDDLTPNPPEGSYLITAVAPNPREKQLDKGTFKSWRMTIRDHQGEQTVNVEWFRKADSPAPAVGQVIEGSIDTTGKFGPKWVAAKKGGPGGGWSGGRPEDPKRSAAILRQHSQHMALLYMQATDTRPESWGDFWKLVDRFDEDVEKARAAA